MPTPPFSEPTETIVVVRPPRTGAQGLGASTQIRSAPQEPEAVGSGDKSGRQPANLELFEVIGEGGMGQVRLARDRVLGRLVAYKRLRTELSGEPEILRRLFAEAQITAQLDHPNVVPLYALAQDDGQSPGYVMKLVEGETLAVLLQREREGVVRSRRPTTVLGRESLLEHFLKVCDAVAFAHAKGVIHRDLKPANIMVGRFNEVYVMDWGIARVLDQPDVLIGNGEQPVRIDSAHAPAGEDVSAWDASSGTPAYMSPEQARGEIERLSPRSDLYSLGLILFEIVCLRRAFGSGEPSTRVSERVEPGGRAPIVARSPLIVPAELRAIIEKATRSAPEDRYPDVAALAQDLRRFLHGESVSVLLETALRRMLRWIGRHRQAVLSLFLATLLLAGSATGTLWYNHIRTMERLRDQRELTTHYLSLASAQAHALVQRLTEVLGHLESLAAAAQIALDSGRETDGPLYTGRDFDSPERRPQNLATSPHYPWGSFDTEHPVVVLPPGGADQAAMAKVRRLLTLTPLLQAIFLDANGVSRDEGVSAAQVREILDRDTLAIQWLGIALTAGPVVGYPGFGGFPPDYDGTRRPWYLQALPEKGRRVCGEPYRDSHSPIFDISCSVALYSRAGTLMGVASLDLSLAGEVRRLLESPQLPQHRALLLNQRGEILQQVGDDLEHAAALLQTYEDETVVEAARIGRSGAHERTDGERSLWVFYIHLPEFGWTYVTEVYAWGAKGTTRWEDSLSPLPPSGG